jgi:tetratricopeptide (TPR) repeat protein
MSTAATSNPEVVRARGDSRVQDPAELGGERTQGGALVSDKEEEEKKSAAVARRTIGPARARPVSSAVAAAIQVRISGRAFGGQPDDRMRMLRRRGVMLLAGALASVGIGLMLGRMQRSGAATEDVTEGSDAPTPKIEPRATLPRISGSDQIELARPRPPSELIADAEAAQTAGQLDDAARLFQKAIDSTQEGMPLRGKARLGLGDVMRAKGDNKEAIAQYRTLIRLYANSTEAAQAKVALAQMNVPLEPPRRSRPPPPPPAAPPVREEPPAAKREVLFKPDDSLSPEEQCEVLLTKHLQDPAQAVEAFEEMRSKHPNAPCVFWNLGRKYERLGRNRQALAAYRRYIELDPQASQRETIEKKKIPNLEAKLRQ